VEGPDALGLLAKKGHAIVETWQIGHQQTKEQAMTKQVQTKEERKAANKALAAEIRALVAKGKADEAYALVSGDDKGAHWTLLVDNAVQAAKAKADKAAEKAKADKADKAPKGKAPKAPKAAEEAPAVSADVAALMQQVQALSEALQALTAPAAPAAAPAAPAAAWLLRDPAASPSGFALCVANRVKAILKAGDADVRSDARTEAMQCAKWCDKAANAESDKAERDRLIAKAGVYRKAAAALKA